MSSRITGRTPPTKPGRFAYEGLDRALHERARLGILTALLACRDGRLFSDLKQLCGLTDGNLSRHLEVLHRTGVVEIWKGFDGHRPQTLCRLSADGTRRFVAYLQELQHVCRDAAPHMARRARPASPPKGFTGRAR
jgi:DNA-binding transcriptional ArsR family regulator